MNESYFAYWIKKDLESLKDISDLIDYIKGTYDNYTGKKFPGCCFIEEQEKYIDIFREKLQYELYVFIKFEILNCCVYIDFDKNITKRIELLFYEMFHIELNLSNIKYQYETIGSIEINGKYASKFNEIIERYFELRGIEKNIAGYKVRLIDIENLIMDSEILKEHRKVENNSKKKGFIVNQGHKLPW